MSYTLICLLKKHDTYFVGDGVENCWSDDINKACLYTPPQATAKLSELSSQEPAVQLLCVIQNKDFNFYDGGEFVYELRQARLYSISDAEAALKRIQSGA